MEGKAVKSATCPLDSAFWGGTRGPHYLHRLSNQLDNVGSVWATTGTPKMGFWRPNLGFEQDKPRKWGWSSQTRESVWMYLFKEIWHGFVQQVSTSGIYHQGLRFYRMWNMIANTLKKNTNVENDVPRCLMAMLSYNPFPDKTISPRNPLFRWLELEVSFVGWIQPKFLHFFVKT